MDEQVQTDETFLQLMQLDNPESVSMFPDTLAWKILFVFFLVAVLVYLWRRYQAYKNRLWKRQALALASELKNAAYAHNWFVLIKRVSLVYKTREELLELDDEHLLALLENLDEKPRESLLIAHYQNKAPLSKEDNQKIYEAFCIWLDSVEESMDV